MAKKGVARWLEYTQWKNSKTIWAKLTLWAYDPCSHIKQHTNKDPVLSLMFCYRHREIPDCFLIKGLLSFSFYSGTHKFCSCIQGPGFDKGEGSEMESPSRTASGAAGVNDRATWALVTGKCGKSPQVTWYCVQGPRVYQLESWQSQRIIPVLFVVFLLLLLRLDSYFKSFVKDAPFLTSHKHFVTLLISLLIRLPDW